MSSVTSPKLLSLIVVDNNECWIWQGGRFGCGYGALSHGGIQMASHRASYLIFKGDFESSLFVCHHCDVPLCCNPDHLFVGSAKDNSRDMFSKGRNADLRGELNAMAQLSSEQARAIAFDTRSNSVVANESGVTASNISCIRNGHTWSHVTGIQPIGNYALD